MVILSELVVGFVQLIVKPSWSYLHKQKQYSLLSRGSVSVWLQTCHCLLKPFILKPWKLQCPICLIILWVPVLVLLQLCADSLAFSFIFCACNIHWFPIQKVKVMHFM